MLIARPRISNAMPLAAGVEARHQFEDQASGTRYDWPGLAACPDYFQPGNTLMVWKLNRLEWLLFHLLPMITHLRVKQIGFCLLTEPMDTTTLHGELLCQWFGALAQYKHALIHERVQTGLAAACRCGRHGGWPRALESGKLEAVIAALNARTSKATMCRTFGILHSTRNDILTRTGWRRHGA